uniref:Peptidase A1 domain-containing protein n=1 Tax=Macrostomum lignano TaxID=282301 RepID=A0A1I8JMP6_9PLAT
TPTCVPAARLRQRRRLGLPTGRPFPCQPRYPPPRGSRRRLPQARLSKASEFVSIDQASMQRFEQLLTAVDFFPACVARATCRRSGHGGVSRPTSWLASNRGISALVRCECIERMGQHARASCSPRRPLQARAWPPHPRLCRRAAACVAGRSRGQPEGDRAQPRSGSINAMPRIEQRTMLPLNVRPGFGFDESPGWHGQLRHVRLCANPLLKSSPCHFVEPLSEVSAPGLTNGVSGQSSACRNLRCAVDQRMFDLDATVSVHLAEVSRMRLFITGCSTLWETRWPRQEIWDQGWRSWPCDYGILWIALNPYVFVPDVHPDYKPRQMHSNLHRHSMDHSQRQIDTKITDCSDQCAGRCLPLSPELDHRRAELQHHHHFLIDSAGANRLWRSQREAGPTSSSWGPATAGETNCCNLIGNVVLHCLMSSLPAGVALQGAHLHPCGLNVKSPSHSGLQTGPWSTNLGVLVTNRSCLCPTGSSVKSFEPLNRFMQRLLDAPRQGQMLLDGREASNLPPKFLFTFRSSSRPHRRVPLSPATPAVLTSSIFAGFDIDRALVLVAVGQLHLQELARAPATGRCCSSFCTVTGAEFLGLSMSTLPPRVRSPGALRSPPQSAGSGGRQAETHASLAVIQCQLQFMLVIVDQQFLHRALQGQLNELAIVRGVQEQAIGRCVAHGGKCAARRASKQPAKFAARQRQKQRQLQRQRQQAIEASVAAAAAVVKVSSHCSKSSRPLQQVGRWHLEFRSGPRRHGRSPVQPTVVETPLPHRRRLPPAIQTACWLRLPAFQNPWRHRRSPHRLAFQSSAADCPESAWAAGMSWHAVEVCHVRAVAFSREGSVVLGNGVFASFCCFKSVGFGLRAQRDHQPAVGQQTFFASTPCQLVKLGGLALPASDALYASVQPSSSSPLDSGRHTVASVRARSRQNSMPFGLWCRFSIESKLWLV